MTTMGNASLPAIMIKHAAMLKSQGMEVSLSMGGETFGGHFSWLKSASAAKTAAQVAAGWAKQYGVGIEIDYEGNCAWWVGE